MRAKNVASLLPQLRAGFKSVGNGRFQRSGKHRVNADGEKSFDDFQRDAKVPLRVDTGMVSFYSTKPTRAASRARRQLFEQWRKFVIERS
jgi:hypothetical protein